MHKRTISIILIFLLLLLQYPLWFGKGGWLRVWELERTLSMQQQTNHELQLRNQKLDGEVKNLREGVDAVEERARYELGMTRADEIYVQVVKPQPGEAVLPAGQPARSPNQIDQQQAALPQNEPTAGESPFSLQGNKPNGKLDDANSMPGAADP